jgi:hypothetical protein
MEGSLSFLVDWYYFLTRVPWAEVGFWFCFPVTVLGFLLFLLNFSFGDDVTAKIIAFCLFAGSMMLLSLFGHLAFGGLL